MASAVTRQGIAALGEKTAASLARLRAEFPTAPDTSAVARHPFYGDMNCVGWLLTLLSHYEAHLRALEEGTSAEL